MAGHNKWSKIKRQKEKTDAQKSKIFSKMAKLISTASREAKGDKNSPVLRAAIDKAREYNMPSDNIERAVKKASESNEQLEAITYEAYGPGGTALVIEALTTNRNKAAQEIKHILSKRGLELARPGSATWAFNKNENREWTPTMEIPVSEEDSKILEELINELEENDEVQEVYTNAA
jgi:YebC/PmpR family DNA-binding regulatory protein